jgi:hypothetical protein
MMKTKYQISKVFVALVMLILVFSSCRKPDDETTPILFVSAETLTFNGSDTEKNFQIKNNTDDGGNGTLSFNISSPESWIAVTPESGSSTNDTRTITVTVDRSGLAYQTYNGTVEITSNGGTHTISVTMINEAPNEAPTASFTISNSSGGYTNTEFNFDASSSSDDSDALDALQIRWKWNDDESFNAWTFQKTATHQYVTAGAKNITLEVKDSDGLVGTTSQSVNVNAPTLPQINTNTPNSITHNSANLQGTILSFGSGAINASSHGFCWSLTNDNLNIANADYIDLGEQASLGEFSYLLEGLNASETYYVKAFAENSGGIAYGDVVSFATTIPPAPQIVTTGNITNILQSSANASGEINSLGIGVTIVNSGHCWSSSNQTPDISNPRTELGAVSNIGEFTSSLSGLSQGTLYYIRAYVELSDGSVSYGETKQFTTLD